MQLTIVEQVGVAWIEVLERCAYHSHYKPSLDASTYSW
jgi:hypothetical protein